MAKVSNHVIGRKVTGATKYSLGDPEEIAQRDSTAFQPPESVFQQIRPGMKAANLNEPDRGVRKSGDFKFDLPYTLVSPVFAEGGNIVGI